jgi:molybdopterin-guanine dinucleotide biosynthesis protein A
MAAIPERAGTTAAIVLAGGQSRRWGGTDKTAADLAGRPVLAHVLAALPPGTPTVVVGPVEHPWARHVDPGLVRWTREDPPGGGPVAGLTAGCAVLPVWVEAVWVLAGDLPFAGPALPRLLHALIGDATQVALGVDPTGRAQPLLAAYRLESLRAALADGGPAAGRSLRTVLSRLQQVEVPVSSWESFDLDSPADLATARHHLGDCRPPPEPAAPEPAAPEPAAPEPAAPEPAAPEPAAPEPAPAGPAVESGP